MVRLLVHGTLSSSRWTDKFSTGLRIGCTESVPPSPDEMKE